MRTAPAIAVSMLAAPTCLAVAALLLDALLPARVQETTAWPGTFRPGNADQLEYLVPLSGGELAACRVGETARSAFHREQPIRAWRSRVLNRCLGVEAMEAASDR